MGLSLREEVEEREKKRSTVLSTIEEEAQIRKCELADLFLGFECSSTWIPTVLLLTEVRIGPELDEYTRAKVELRVMEARDLLIGCCYV